MAEQRLCSIPDCNKPRYAHGHCKKHAYRVKKYGDPNFLQKARGRKCSVQGCENPHDSHGYCGAHAMRFKRHGDPLGGGTPHHEPDTYLQDVVLPYAGEDCLIWPYGRTPQGYGQIHVGDTTRVVSRIVCEKTHGEPPTPKHEAAHSCGQGHLGCVTPAHVRWATKIENEADKIGHGTYQIGEKNPIVKLTAEQVVEIRGLRGKMSQYAIAKLFGISQPSVSLILSGKNWGWMHDQDKARS